MKNILLSLAAITLGGMMLSAQNISNPEDGKYTITNGDVTMTIDASRGGKIVSYKYQDQEVLSQSRFPNSFGSTFWTSPQSDWNWPPVREYDSMAYEAGFESDSLVLTGQKSERFGMRIRKSFKSDEKTGAITITYTIINESGQTRQVAPWEITRVPNGGMVFFQAKETVPANRMKGLPFTFEKGAAWFVMDEDRANRKINADGKGWLAFCDNGLMFVKKFQDLDPSQLAPAEAEIQIYANPGKTYVEIEEQGAYTKLEPGDELSWNVTWYLFPYETEAGPSKAALKKALKTVRK